MKLLNSKFISIASFALSSAWVVSCTLPEAELDEQTSSGSDGDTSDSSSPSGETGSDEEAFPQDGSYVVRGGVPSGEFRVSLVPNLSTLDGHDECPFPAESPPCTDEACLEDFHSEACFDVIDMYCEENPEVEACQEPGPGDGPEGGHDGGGHDGGGPDGGGHDGGPDDGGHDGGGHDGGGGEGWACDADPDWPPCETCLDPDATKEQCDEAVMQYCEENPEDQWCQHGPDEGGHDGGHGGGWGEPDAIYTPDSLSIKVYKVEFSTDAEGCTDPITVGEMDEPEYQDFFNSPTLVTAEPPPAGTYPCVIITMSDHIKWTLDNDSDCGGEQTQDVYSAEDMEGHDGIEQVIKIYMSTAGSNDDPHDDPDFDPRNADPEDFPDPFSAPGMYLGEPHIAGPGVLFSTFISDVTDKIEVRTDGGGTRCDMQPPDWSFQTTYKE